jgi:protein-disulfide isomerase
MLMPDVTARDHSTPPLSEPRSVTLVLFGDFESQECREAAAAVLSLREAFRGRLRFVFRHFPLGEEHPRAKRAAEASEAAGAQGKFWEMFALLMLGDEVLDDEELVAFADELELDVRHFKQELFDGTYEARVAEDVESGKRSGVETAPTFFVNGELHDEKWSEASLSRAISRAAGEQEAA